VESIYKLTSRENNRGNSPELLGLANISPIFIYNLDKCQFSKGLQKNRRTSIIIIGSIIIIFLLLIWEY
jgi:hypothetical protein